MPLKLFERRTVTYPTLLGWALLLGLSCLPIVAWWFGAEHFFAITERVPADILVIEAWTGSEGVAAAAKEFKQPGNAYKYVVVAGGMAGQPWSDKRWSYAEVGRRDLLRLGIPASQIIEAQSVDVATQRTHETAIAARDALRAIGLNPLSINVFTRGAHARRSRIIFAKVFGAGTQVGVISWSPTGFYNGPWWHSSIRADELIKETVGYFYEIMLNSGRRSVSTVAFRGIAGRAHSNPSTKMAWLPSGRQPT